MGKVLAVVAIAVATTACAGATEVNPSAGYRDTIQGFLDMARGAGASQEQIDVLVAGVETGSITFEQIQGLENDLLACYEDAGFTTSAVTPVELYPNSGIYTFSGSLFPPPGLTEQEEGDLVNYCSWYHFDYANAAYMESPVAVDARYERYVDPRVFECLRNQGFTVDDDATGSELHALVSEDILAHIDSGDQAYRGCEFPSD
jgi:hypothetical protein